MPVLNGSAAGRVITRYKTYTSYNVLHLVIRIFVTVNSFASDVLAIYGFAVYQACGTAPSHHPWTPFCPSPELTPLLSLPLGCFPGIIPRGNRSLIEIPMSVDVGTRLGSLEITALLGKGGMGEVYRARDTKLKRDVAIKILPDELSRDPRRVNRFQRE